MKNFFTTDIPMKILSLVLAVILWIYLVVLLNPEIETTVTDIPVSFSDHLTLTQNGYVVLNDKQYFVDLKLKGTRNMLSNVNKNNITAYVDLSTAKEAGTFALPIHIRLPYEEVTVLEKKPYNINVVIDKIVTTQLNTTINLKGTQKEGYAVYNPTTTQKIVEVKGPQELIKTIYKAVLDVDINNANDDVISLETVKLLNSSGDSVESKYFTISPEKIEVHCPILRKKTVPVKAVLSGDSSKYDVAIIGSTEIVILGKDQALADVNEIYTNPITVDNISETVQKEVQVVLPQGVYQLQPETNVTVEIKLKNGNS